MHFAIGSDHAGFELKEAVKGFLSELGHSYHDFGCYEPQSVDSRMWGDRWRRE